MFEIFITIIAWLSIALILFYSFKKDESTSKEYFFENYNKVKQFISKLRSK